MSAGRVLSTTLVEIRSDMSTKEMVLVSRIGQRVQRDINEAYLKACQDRDALRAALDMIYNAEGDHPVCGCPVHKAIFDAWAKHGV